MWRRPDCGSAPGGSGRYCPDVPFTWPRGFWSQPSLGLQGPELWLASPPALSELRRVLAVALRAKADAMTDIRLSFVIPARNEEALIGEALEAILASVARASGVCRNDLWLPDTSFEVIVADDGSDDATAAIVGIFAD